MSTRWFWLLIGLAFLGGAALRTSIVVTQQDVPPGRYQAFSGDGFDYLVISGNIADGTGYRGLGGVESGRPPMWPMLLTAARVAIGEPSAMQLQLVAAGVGSLSIVLLGMAGRRMAGATVGIVAAGIAAVDPGFWIFEWPLLSETFFLSAASLFILAVYRYIDQPGIAGAMVLGGLSAVVALTRSEQILLVPLVVVPVILLTRSKGLRTRAVWLAGSALACIAVLAPWVGFNVARFEEPVLLSTGFGNTLLAGNCDSTYNGELLGSWDPDCTRRLPAGFQGDWSEKDPELRQVATRYMADNIGRLPVVVMAREGRVWGFYRPGDTYKGWSEWSLVPSWQAYAWIGAFYVLLPLAIIGALRLRQRHRPIYPLLAFPAIVAFTTALTIGDSRYRAAAEPTLVLLAAVGVAAVVRRLAERIRGRRYRREPPATEGDTTLANSPAADPPVTSMTSD